jgi:alkylation response protein AidB-like acyl-CoA dehydrogenase
MGPYAAPYLQDNSDTKSPLGDEAAAKAASSYFNNRKLSIFGGSNEIQKNIISKMILGL